MHIEIFQTEPVEKSDPWYWHKNNKGKITCDSEAFPTKANAVRAAKADVTQTIKPYDGMAHFRLVFVLKQDAKCPRLTTLRWSR